MNVSSCVGDIGARIEYIEFDRIVPYWSCLGLLTMFQWQFSIDQLQQLQQRINTDM